jgi:Holliday junction resolvasome RuvABC ATP-dependent DNA helicase subunit
MTNTTTAPFASLIGQQNIKSKLQFAIETKEAKRPLPHFLFTASYGFGKTRFIREFAKTITNGGTTGKYVEINSANIKSVSWFVEKVYMPYLQDRDNVTVLCDEAHELPKSVQTWLLTVLNTEKSHIRRVVYDDSEIEFDFLRTSIHFATTDANKLSKPLKSRMEIMTFAPYSQDDLARIIQINCPDVDFQDNILQELVFSIKPYPRAAEILARKVNDFCAIKGRKEFDSADFVNLSKMADIKLHGLDNIEVGILKLLDERGPMTLTEISACLSIPANALRQDHEHHLLKKGLLRLDGKRVITAKGSEAARSFKMVDRAA